MSSPTRAARPCKSDAFDETRFAIGPLPSLSERCIRIMRGTYYEPRFGNRLVPEPDCAGWDFGTVYEKPGATGAGCVVVIGQCKMSYRTSKTQQDVNRELVEDSMANSRFSWFGALSERMKQQRAEKKKKKKTEEEKRSDECASLISTPNSRPMGDVPEVVASSPVFRALHSVDPDCDVLFVFPSACNVPSTVLNTHAVYGVFPDNVLVIDSSHLARLYGPSVQARGLLGMDLEDLTRTS